MTSKNQLNISQATTRLSDRWRDLLRDKKGVGAVEFAFIAPILVILYIGAVEMTVALAVDTKVSRAANITLDLITQGTSTTRAELDAMTGVAGSVLAPYQAGDLELKYTAITVSDDGTKATVDWSWGSDTLKPYVAGNEIEIPASLMIAEAFYIRGEILKTHDFITSISFSNSNATSLGLNETYFMRPRLGTSIGCDDCND